jgi:hypothetical protein
MSQWNSYHTTSDGSATTRISVTNTITTRKSPKALDHLTTSSARSIRKNGSVNRRVERSPCNTGCATTLQLLQKFRLRALCPRTGLSQPMTNLRLSLRTIRMASAMVIVCRIRRVPLALGNNPRASPRFEATKKCWNVPTFRLGRQRDPIRGMTLPRCNRAEQVLFLPLIFPPAIPLAHRSQ